VTAEQSQRIAALQTRYQVKFELRLSAATSRNNYEYLDILDRTWARAGFERPGGGLVCDIGCASFWYAAALQAFFRPRELVGIEVEGHRLFRNGHTRIDYALGYVGDLPNARFVVADYRTWDLTSDTLMAWFPFVTPQALLAWRLPLGLLSPEALFGRVFHNLKPGGTFLMVNHGFEEAETAATLCNATGLRRVAECGEAGLLSDHRDRPAIASCWTRDRAAFEHNSSFQHNSY
jgi:hypothetical protein